MTLNLDTALYAKLSQTAGISALVSDRIYPTDIPAAATLPLVVYTEVSSSGIFTHDEAVGAGLFYARYQVDSYGSTHASATALAAAIHSALHGFTGTITSGADTFIIYSCLRSGRRSEKDAEVGIYRRSQEYLIAYKE